MTISMRNVCTILTVALLIAADARGDDPAAAARHVDEGNRLLAARKFEDALAAYDRARTERPASPEINYNRGIALYELGRHDQAATAFQDAIVAGRRELEAKAKYNLGRTAQAQAMQRGEDIQAALNDLTRSIGFYKDALQLAPDDERAKQNLNMAQRLQGYLKRRLELMKEQQPPEQQQQQQQSGGDASSQPAEEDRQQQQDSASSQPSQSGEQQNAEGEQSGDQSSQSQESSQSQQQQQQQSGESGEQQDRQQRSESDEKQSPDGDALEQELEADEQHEKEQSNGEQQDEPKPGQRQPSKPTGDESKERQPPPRQNGDSGDKKKDTESPQQPQPGSEDQQQQQESGEQMSTGATTQPADANAADPERLSRERAMRLLQEARDAEMKRREALREARLRRLQRRAPNKDW